MLGSWARIMAMEVNSQSVGRWAHFTFCVTVHNFCTKPFLFLKIAKYVRFSKKNTDFCSRLTENKCYGIFNISISRGKFCVKKGKYMIQKALILAAGKGTRFLPYTKAYPKEMLAVVDKPAMQILVEEIVQAGITDILVVISQDKQKVVEHFTPDWNYVNQLETAGKNEEAQALKDLANLADVKFVYQNAVTGTAKAVELAEGWADGQPFVVLNGDDVILAEKSATLQVAEAFERCHKPVVGVQAVTKEAIKRYATCKIIQSDGRLHKIDDIVEKPQTEAEVYSLLAPLGRYVLTADIFDVIKATPAKKSGEVYLTDSLQIMAKNGGIFVYEFEGERFDFGDKLGYVKGFTRYALNDPRFGAEYLQFLKQLVK